MKIPYFTLSLVAVLSFSTKTAFAQQDTIQNTGLKEVIIQKESKAQKESRQPVRATVLDVKAMKQQPSSVIELMNRAVGVRVRQTGGLGNNASLMLNGFEGNAIKYFRDGIPMDYLGNAFSFSVVPPTMIDRIEIYKGVVPVSLGADALGGAVNIVTKEPESNQSIDASYQIGSYNTHRGTLNAYFQDKQTGLFGGVNAFINYSDNDYKVNVPYTDPETAQTRKEKHKLFHNRFTNGFVEGFIGVKNKTWADELRLTVSSFYINKQHNYGMTMNYPFGGVTSNMNSVVPTLRYRKAFLDNNLKLDQFLVYNTLHSSYTDTIKGFYDWRGKFTPVASKNGEATSNGSLKKLRYYNFISRTNLSYRLDNGYIELNSVYNSSTRRGSDPFGETFPFSKIDMLQRSVVFQKWITGLNWRLYALDDRLTNDLSVKYYYLRTEGYESMHGDTQMEQQRSKTKGNWGFSESLKYQFTDRIYARFSGELAVRLPEQAEFFGDGTFTRTNFALKPERSWNYNLGVNYNNQTNLTTEVNVFYRRTHDMIMLLNTGIFGNYENIDKIKGVGVEIDAAYSPLKWLRLSGNVTYQDFRLYDKEDKTYEGARLRNTPYFFANLGLRTSHDNVFKSGDKFSFYYNYSFVKAYYLDFIPKEFEPSGFLGLWGKAEINAEAYVIPDQNLHSAGMVWSYSPKLSFGFEAKNIFNSEIFDNYKIQNEGFSLHFKVNLSIN
ncbi:Outer membrane receptor proteins, mostly Fe transport [Myroides marinus]|uniref:Outer membrane receptor proteins, mostly Fe transport n=1 Tax=Myroides marinus TaxID=703342 RepID=A0A1H6YII2_9FLAO|nr:TonB-dependent receptor [Myroides marinus]SEJ38757.1 Outer membrane receptor proteins, mostly Fe transport [Myroides marinus]